MRLTPEEQEGATSAHLLQDSVAQRILVALWVFSLSSEG